MKDSPSSFAAPLPTRPPRKPRRIWRVLLAVLLIAALFLTLAFVYRSALVNLLAPAFLTRVGLQKVSFRVRNLGASHVEIDHATGLIALPAGHVRVQLEGVAYDFNFRQLLAGKVERFTVAKAELSLPDWQKAANTQTGPQQKPNFSLEQIFQLAEKIQVLPLEALQVDALVVHASLFGKELTTPSLRLEYASNAQGGKVSLRQQGEQKDAAPPLSPLALDLAVFSKVLQFNMEAEPASLQQWLPVQLPLQQGRFKLQARIDPGNQQSRSIQMHLQATGIGTADWQADSLQIAVNASSPPDQETLFFSSDSQLSLQGFKSTLLRLDKAHLPLQGRLHFAAEQYQLDWQPQSLAFRDIRFGDTRIAALQADGLSLQAELARADGDNQPQAGKDQELGHIALGADSRLELRQLSTPAMRFDTLQTRIPLQLRLFTGKQQMDWRPNNPLVVQGLQVGSKAEATAFAPLHLREFRLHYARDKTASRANAFFLLPEAGGGLQVDWQHKAGSASQELTVRTPSPWRLNADSSPLRLLQKGPAALETVVLEQGRVKADLRLNWGKSPLSARLNVDVEGGMIRQGNMEFSGITLQQRLQLAPQLRSEQAGAASVQAIKGPIAFNDLSARLQVLPPGKKGGASAFLVSDAKAGVFDGAVRAAECRYDPGRSKNSCTVTLHNLDMAAILALHKVEGLAVSGRINGRVPVQLDKTGFRVTDGVLRDNDAGGVIRYTPSGDALKSSPYSEYVLKALEDYRYHSLNASLTYAPDGALVAGLQLQGKSPALETNRPVHLNLHAEQNLLSLLKSLQYSQGLTSELNRRVQERFQPRQKKK